MVSSDLHCVQFALEALTAPPDQCRPCQRPRACLDKFSEVIAVCGGFNENDTSAKSNVCFVPSSNSWCKLANLIEGQAFCCSVQMDGFLYLFGGKRGFGINEIINNYPPKWR